MRVVGLVAWMLAVSCTAWAQGPGLGNLSYAPNEVFRPLGWVENGGYPNGTNVAIMVRGYMMVIFAHDSGGPPGEIAIYDVSNPRDPVQRNHVRDGDTEQFREAHSLPVGIVGGREYVAVQTIRGIQMWDLTDPLSAHRVASLDLPGVNGGDYDNVAWQATWEGRYLYVAGSNLGVFVVDAFDPTSPRLLNQVSNAQTGGFRVGPLYAMGDQLVVSNMDQDIAIAVLDITDPLEPALIGQYRERYNLYTTLAFADRIYGAGRDGSVVTYDMSDPTDIFRVGIANIGGDVLYVATQDHHVFAGRQNDFAKLDVSDERNVRDIGSGTLDRDHPDHGQVTPLGNLIYIGNDHETGSALFAHQEGQDREPPGVHRVYPRDGTVGVSQASRVSVAFGDYLDTSTLRPDTLSIRPAGGEPLEGIYTYCFNVVSFSPEAELAADTTYEIVVHAGGVKDVMGNAVAEEVLARFSTGGEIVEPPPPPPPPPDDEDESEGDDDGSAADDSADGEESGADGGGDQEEDTGDGGDSSAGGEETETSTDAITTTGSTCSLRPVARGSWPWLLLGLGVLVRGRRRAVAQLMAAFVPAALCTSLASTAHAVSVTARENAPHAVGAAIDFDANAVGTGDITYSWDFGDGTRTEFSGEARVTHRYDAPGHYAVIVVAKDASGVRSDSFLQTVHRPLPEGSASSSSTIVFDAAGGRVCNVNADQDTVTCLDTASLAVTLDVPVGDHPRTLAADARGNLWVTNQDAASISRIDASGDVEEVLQLPYGSRPYGIAIDAARELAYVTLEGSGELAKVDLASARLLGTVDVGRLPSGLSISHDGARVLVTRLISPVDHGEVVEVDGPGMKVVRTFELAANPGPDTEAQSRGIPNYLRAVVIQPDGSGAWVPSKLDNTLRGMARDGLPLTHETAVRTVVSALDLADNREVLEDRVDLNNRSLGLALTFSPLGDYAFVALMGVNGLSVVDTYNRNVVSGALELPRAPDGLVLDDRGRLFVNAFLSRSVVVLDASGVLASTDFALPVLEEVRVVEQDALAPELLRGKQLFYDAADLRIANDGYISCAVCHLEGFEDGRVWDFTDRGEGFRNTTSLLGRRGTGHGRVHWSANFDEIQDFEHDIRNAFGGTGLLPDELWNQGTRNTTLGDAKAGLSPELDALAAFVSSLARVHDSPFRAADGELTQEGWRGRSVFMRAGCQACHGGPDFTDSASGALHDVGTLQTTSGQRLGGLLDGLDTPTLRGIWETAPYLHDGSAATLMEVLTTRNAADLHGQTSQLSESELADLHAYLLQIDNTALEDEREPPPDMVGEGDEPGSDDAPASEAASCRLGTSAAPSWPLALLPWVALRCSRRRRV